jgi:hypothetical protein
MYCTQTSRRMRVGLVTPELAAQLVADGVAGRAEVLAAHLRAGPAAWA